MNKALILFLVLAGLAAFVNAADVAIKVGSDTGNVFEPAELKAAPGDNLVFTWAGTAKHSVFQEAKAKDCAKSTDAAVFINSEMAYTAPKTWTVAVPKDATGKIWFYCGVPGHCTPGTGGMEAVVEITGAAGGDGKAPAGGDGKAPAGGDGKAPADGKTPTDPAAGASPSATPNAASQNFNSLAFVFSSMCLAAAYML